MPELPEVETIRRGLEQKVKGKRIERVMVRNEKSVKTPPSSEFVQKIQGKVFSQMHRRGKYLILGLDSGDSLVLHLGMTGRLIYSKAREEIDYSRVVFLLENNAQLSFTDVRGFGGLWFVPDEKFEEAVPTLANLGPEPLEKDFTLEKFKQLLKGKKGKIKSLLMDQTFIAGVGNIYAQEALFLSGIHPTRSPSLLLDQEIEKLYHNLLSVLKKAILHRGSSVDTYVDLDGREGNYEPRLRVYGRGGMNCLRCGRAIERMEVGGRGTYFCPRCQK